MKLDIRPYELSLKHTWSIARDLDENGMGGSESCGVIFVELEDEDGFVGIGEAAPTKRYRETVDSVLNFLNRIEPNHLSFSKLEESMAYLDSVSTGEIAAKGALNIALLDGAGKKQQMPIHRLLNLSFTERKHVTSFSIGIDSPEIVHAKVKEAESYPVLKLKLGSHDDAVNFKSLRQAAPKKEVRVDGNEGWKTKEEALSKIEWLATDGAVQFVEQPMPSSTSAKDWIWLKERSPLPIMADESYLNAGDIDFCAECFDAVNVKLVKAGGIFRAHEALLAARKAGLKTMLGCMIESSVLITAAAHLAELTDYLDIDGNLLISNDPFLGVSSNHGIISFADSPVPDGLRIRKRN